MTEDVEQIKKDIAVMLRVVERATDFNITKMYASELESCNRLKRWIE